MKKRLDLLKTSSFRSSPKPSMLNTQAFNLVNRREHICYANCFFRRDLVPWTPAPTSSVRQKQVIAYSGFFETQS